MTQPKFPDLVIETKLHMSRSYTKDKVPNESKLLMSRSYTKNEKLHIPLESLLIFLCKFESTIDNANR